MIRHTVMFTLVHPEGSTEEAAFMDAALELNTIKGVQKFERLRQVSDKCTHRFGFSMEFDSQTEYDFYNDHPLHSTFVNDRWKVEVDTFQEIDYIDF